jgi:hypothetical protein
MKLGIFLQGLPDEYQVCVTHLEFEQHTTYAVACQRVVDFALRYDLGNFENGGRAEEGAMYAHTPKTQTPSDSLRKKNRENKKQKKGAAKGSSGPKCYNCGERGHVQAKCPAKGRGKKCFHYQKFGHIANDCPQRGETETKSEAAHLAAGAVYQGAELADDIFFFAETCETRSQRRRLSARSGQGSLSIPGGAVAARQPWE